MVSSMTAFAQFETQNWLWELRSVNHRFLDLTFNLPTTFQALEQELRSAARGLITRGRVDANLSHSSLTIASNSAVNEAELSRLISNAQLVQRLAENRNEQLRHVSDEPLRLIDILQWPGVLNTAQPITSDLREEVCNGFVSALKSLVDSRQREGTSLKQIFQSRLNTIREILNQLSVYSDRQVLHVNDKLLGKLKKLPLEVHSDRIAQEVAILAQRADINEEIDRLNVHVSEFEKCMAEKSSSGRRLGFIVQEMAREANTLAAKLVVPEAITLSVDLKVLTDQIREQAQNVE